MKKQILIAVFLFISVISFGQKKEIKAAQKAIKSGNFTEAISILNKAEGLINNAESSLKEYFYLVKGQAYFGDAGNDFEKLNTAADSYEKVLSLNVKSKYAAESEDGIENVKAGLINGAILDQKTKKNSDASKKLYRAYNLSKSDTTVLYYAAANAVNAKEYDNAIEYYQQLLDLDYTGIVKEYYATEKASNVEKMFTTKSERDEVLKSGDFILPKEKLSKSAKGEMLRNMTLIYVSQGKIEDAKALMVKARKENPDDIPLMRAESDMHYKNGDMVSYKKIVNEMINKDPNNPELYYNLGVASNKNGEQKAAMEYYTKAIELNPDYAEALINKAQLILNKESSIVEEMNSLGTSNADYDRYDELKEVKNNIYKDAVPYLEKATSLRPKNIDLLRTLKNIYSTLGMDDKAKNMKTRLSELEN